MLLMPHLCIVGIAGADVYNRIQFRPGPLFRYMAWGRFDDGCVVHVRL